VNRPALVPEEAARASRQKGKGSVSISQAKSLDIERLLGSRGTMINEIHAPSERAAQLVQLLGLAGVHPADRVGHGHKVAPFACDRQNPGANSQQAAGVSQRPRTKGLQIHGRCGEGLAGRQLSIDLRQQTGLFTGTAVELAVAVKLQQAATRAPQQSRGRCNLEQVHLHASAIEPGLDEPQLIGELVGIGLSQLGEELLRLLLRRPGLGKLAQPA
jgi:hypothetical protein